MDSGFLNTLYGKKRKPGNAESQQKAFSIKKHPVLMIYRYYKTAKKESICYLSTILAIKTSKAFFKLQW